MEKVSVSRSIVENAKTESVFTSQFFKTLPNFNLLLEGLSLDSEFIAYNPRYNASVYVKRHVGSEESTCEGDFNNP